MLNLLSLHFFVCTVSKIQWGGITRAPRAWLHTSLINLVNKPVFTLLYSGSLQGLWIYFSGTCSCCIELPIDMN